MKHTIFKQAPVFAGAVFVASFTLLTASCERKAETPDWDQPGGSRPAKTLPASEQSSPPAAPPKTAAPARSSQASAQGLRFMAYNVRNWLTMDRYDEGKKVKGRPKPVSEKSVVIGLITAHNPDVVGICEIGTAGDLAELQAQLKSAGLALPHSHYTGGADPVRHLGLLSRFPITATAKPAETEFQLEGKTFAINRGILDATVTARGKPYRFLGVHLKSKREIEEADQEQMRIWEARLLRRHIDAIQKADPDARLVVYGDFNDTRKTKAVTAITGRYNSRGYITTVPFKDSRGHAWTHHWSHQDIYSRIDFVGVSRSLRQDLDFQASYIVDDPDNETGSDHRPLLTIFR